MYTLEQRLTLCLLREGAKASSPCRHATTQCRPWRDRGNVLWHSAMPGCKCRLQCVCITAAATRFYTILALIVAATPIIRLFPCLNGSDGGGLAASRHDPRLPSCQAHPLATTRASNSSMLHLAMRLPLLATN